MQDVLVVPLSDGRQAPPSARPKHRNALLRLYDAPFYRDWAVWLTLFWLVIAPWSIVSEPSDDSTAT